MSEDIKKAIKILLTKIDDSVSADEALKYTQAACNLANTDSCILVSDRARKQDEQG